MLSAIIPLVASFLPMFGYAIWFYFALEFVAWVPFFIHYLIRRD